MNQYHHLHAIVTFFHYEFIFEPLRDFLLPFYHYVVAKYGHLQRNVSFQERLQQYIEAIEQENQRPPVLLFPTESDSVIPHPRFLQDSPPPIPF